MQPLTMSKWQLLSLLCQNGTAWKSIPVDGVPKKFIFRSVERESGSGCDFNLAFLDPDTNVTHTVFCHTTD